MAERRMVLDDENPQRHSGVTVAPPAKKRRSGDMDEENLVAVRSAIVMTAVSRILAGFGMTAQRTRWMGLRGVCLASKLYTVEQGASLAHFDGVNSRMRQGNMCGMPSVEENTKARAGSNRQEDQIQEGSALTVGARVNTQ